MRLFCLLILFALLTSGCSPDGQSPRSRPSAQRPSNSVKEYPLVILENGEPSYITVQHILIAVRGRLPGKRILRTKEEAAKLAGEVLEKAKSGEDFDALVKEYTDDSPPGIYRLANRGQEADPNNGDPAQRVMPRGGAVAAFGNVGFALEVGEIGMSELDFQDSPFGWHIIKRLK